MTLAHHHATFDDERRGREAKFLGADNAAITTSRPVLSCPSVCSRTRPPQVIEQQRLLYFGEAESQGMPACLI